MTNTYNADNLRTTKTVGNTTTEYVWDGQNLVSETEQGTTDTYTYDMTGVHTRKHGNTVTSYLKDYHGNVIGTADSTGRLDYDAYGNHLQGDAPDPFGYCGEYYDSETGLIYLRNRYYDPSMGRFISEDPAKGGLNWYVYCDNNPIMFVDPLGEDAIIITNSNSVDVKVTTLGHTSAIYQDANGEWYYTYWGNKAAAVIHISSEYMGSLSDFNKGLNKFLSDNGFKNITSDYTHATYIVGDFEASLEAAYADVNDAATNRFSTKNGLTTLEDGSKVFQGHNSPYNAGYRNCFDKTFASLSKGILENGMNAGTYMKDLGFKGGMIPNNAISKFSEVFMNSSFTYSGAYSSLLNYAILYVQGSPWAQKWSKANYANAVIGW